MTTQRPPGRIADRQAAARRRHFVGREEELALFRAALQSAQRGEDGPFAVLHIHGPGGVGKTTMLRELTRLADEASVPVWHIDARNLTPDPEGFLGALRAVMRLDEGASPIEAWPRDTASVLVLDTYEQLAPMDAWLREQFLPQLPARAIVAIAGRNGPSPAWRTDPDWRDMHRVVALRNLSLDEGRAYLASRGVPARQHDAALRFTHGHPLALSLLADLSAQSAHAELALDRAQDVVAMLLERFVERVPSARHRLALQTCAHALAVTEPLLREALQEGDVHDMFDWLRALSFIEHGPFGLFPHDLARDVLDNEARWRDPDTYVALHRRIRSHYIERMPGASGRDQQRHMMGLMYLHRNNPIVRPFFAWKELGTRYVEPANAADLELVADMIERYRGTASARVALYWAQRQPSSILVVRDASGEIAGLALHLELDEITAEDEAHDPGLRAIARYVGKHGALRPGEKIMIMRLGIDALTVDRPGPASNAVQIFECMRWILEPALAWSFICVPNPDDWAPLMSYSVFHRAYEADFDVDGPNSAFVHDWRAMPAPQWLDLMGGREIATDMTLDDVVVAAPRPLIVLSRQEFDESVKQALKEFARPNALAANPLARSRLVSERADAPAAALQALLREAVDQLKVRPKDLKFHRAVWHTYIEPAATQEAAAELLDLPFTTYRYQLATGLQRIADWLWQRELGAGA